MRAICMKLAWAWALAGAAGPALAAATGPAALPPEALPPSVQAEWQRTQLPTSALSALVVDASPNGEGRATTWLSWRAQAPMNPASVLKLVTTFAALDQLGPAYTWRTTAWVDGPVRDGVLQGNLYLKGSGDPKLVTERLWLLLRRVQGLGIQRIAGDLVLDRSAYALPARDPAAFDGEALRPYNASPDALLVNYKSLVMSFVPDAAAGVARVSAEPPLAGWSLPAEVPLASGDCGDWRTGLQLDMADPQRWRFLGRYPSACGERVWPLAHPEPDRFAERAVGGLWAQLGGRLDGRVREGRVPATATQRLAFESPALAEVVRDVNKYSNNVMAQQVFLALAGENSNGNGADFTQAQQALAQWWARRIGSDLPVPQADTGSGLSRETRISAAALARLLQVAYASGLMPELMASLPVSGQDGTLRRQRQAVGSAHLKTGSLRDVVALAGYVHGPQGQRRIFVALVNHPNAAAARPALDALLQWAAGL